MPMTREGDSVHITITADQYQDLVLALGMASDLAFATEPNVRLPLTLQTLVSLSNAINEGNPQWRPYEMKEIRK